jgi:methylphosphotriester-DNA--protein-cysteine methyltransferase
MNQRRRLDLIGAAPSDAQWAAISERRRVPDTKWLLVVTSTGIACLPGCPARTPGRDRVRIVASLVEALEAGARPCLRCHPERSAGSGAGSPAASRTQGDAVEVTVGRLAAALASGDDVPTDRELATAVGLSERRLREIFPRALGVTPRGWVAAKRAERLRVHLAGGGEVLGALFDAGYGSSSAAYEAAGGELGMAPGRYRTGGAGERIRWTARRSPTVSRWSRRRTEACARCGSARSRMPLSRSCAPSSRAPPSRATTGHGRHGGPRDGSGERPAAGRT